MSWLFNINLYTFSDKIIWQSQSGLLCGFILNFEILGYDFNLWLGASIPEGAHHL